MPVADANPPILNQSERKKSSMILISLFIRKVWNLSPKQKQCLQTNLLVSRCGAISMRASLEAWIHRQWAKRGLLAFALSPFSLVFLLIARLRRRRTTPIKLPVPTIVVGNIYVGGTGKTPVTIALVRQLVALGWHPGIVSRGYASSGNSTRLVSENSTAKEVGDEPLLIYQATKCPVAVNKDRVSAAKVLLKTNPAIDVIISDDGLQHLRLDRDVEIAVVGARGLGNGWVLPAGPLREPASRLDSVDAVVLNATDETLATRTPRFAATSQLGQIVQLATGRIEAINRISETIKTNQWKTQALAGIALPDRFFSMLRAHDIDCTGIRLPDHFDFSENPFKSVDADMIFITGKDAVKCRQIPEIAQDTRIWVADLEMVLDQFLIDFIVEKITQVQDKEVPTNGHALD